MSVWWKFWEEGIDGRYYIVLAGYIVDDQFFGREGFFEGLAIGDCAWRAGDLSGMLWP